MTSVEDIRTLVFQLLEQRFRLTGIGSSGQLDDSFDLFESGVLDSLAFVELVVGLEERLGIAIDFAELPTNQISNFGHFCSFVHAKAAGVPR
jgi:acyl carrier protein